MEDLVFVHQIYGTGESVVKCAKSVKKVEIEFYTNSNKVKRIEVERDTKSDETIHNTRADRQADGDGVLEAENQRRSDKVGRL